MKGELNYMYYHLMNAGSIEQVMDTLDFPPDARQPYYILIVSFTKLDIIIKLLTDKEINGVKLQKEMECYMPSKICKILEEGIQCRFLENSTEITRRWLDVILIKNNKQI